jgi:hypothetical protein
MYSNEVSGKQSAPISNVLLFHHSLTRLYFRLSCEAGKSYPKVVTGIRVSDRGAMPTARILTKATLNLLTGSYTFSLPNSVIGSSADHPDGFGVPPDGFPEIIDMMIVPATPFVVSVIMSDNTEVSTEISSALDDNGGAMGRQYIINLKFSGNTILAGSVSIAQDWTADTSLPGKTGNNSGAWW